MPFGGVVESPGWMGRHQRMCWSWNDSVPKTNWARLDPPVALSYRKNCARRLAPMMVFRWHMSRLRLRCHCHWHCHPVAMASSMNWMPLRCCKKLQLASCKLYESSITGLINSYYPANIAVGHAENCLWRCWDTRSNFKLWCLGIKQWYSQDVVASTAEPAGAGDAEAWWGWHVAHWPFQGSMALFESTHIHMFHPGHLRTHPFKHPRGDWLKNFALKNIRIRGDWLRSPAKGGPKKPFFSSGE